MLYFFVSTLVVSHRPCPCGKHAARYLRGHRTAGVHPLPGGCQPACHFSEVEKRQPASAHREGESSWKMISVFSQMLSNGPV